MRQLARHLFTLSAAASLVLCVAVCVLWARSYHGEASLLQSYAAEDHVVFQFRGSSYSLRSTKGRLRLGNEHLMLEWRSRAYARIEQSLALGREMRWRLDRVRELRNASREMLRSEREVTRDAVGRLQDEIDALNEQDDALDPFGIPPPTVPGFAYAVPHWVPAVGFAVLPAAWLVRRFRRSRALKRGLCTACGYDLRASPGRCPECGAAAATRQSDRQAP